VSLDYEHLNRAQSTASGPHGPLIRLVSRIAMLTLEVPAAMKAGDWPEQRRIRGDLDEAAERLSNRQIPDFVKQPISELRAAGLRSVKAIVSTPRDDPGRVDQARWASVAAVAAVEKITSALAADAAELRPYNH
jgi:hypothetical protein